jgi:flagellar export protein FliJ
MKPFKFTLEPLRTVRQRQERQAMEAYAMALFERARALKQVQFAERLLAGAQVDWQRSAAEGCPAVEMSRHALHCHDLAGKCLEQHSLFNVAEQTACTRLKEMLLARQQCQAVDKFLVRQRLAYNRELSRQDQKFIDELAQRRLDPGLAQGFNEKADL